MSKISERSFMLRRRTFKEDMWKKLYLTQADRCLKWLVVMVDTLVVFTRLSDKCINM